MAIKLIYPIDELELAQHIDDGWTTLTLWSSDLIEGPYSVTSASFDPATLAAAQAAGIFVFTIEDSASNPGQWFKVRAYDGANYSDISLAKPFHGGGGTTFTALRRIIGRLTGDMDVFECTESGSTTTAISNKLAALREPNGFFASRMAYNPANGESAFVSASTRTTGASAKVTLTLEPSVTSTTSSTVLELTKRWSREDYRNAINWAVQACYPTLHRAIVNTGLRTGDDLHQLFIPQDIRRVQKIEVESNSNTSSSDGASRGHPFREEPFQVIRDDLVQFAEFKIPPTSTPGERRVRIRGLGTLSPVYNDSDYTEAIQPEVDLLAAMAGARLWGTLAGEAASSDREFYMNMSKELLAMYGELRKGLARSRPPQKIWSQGARWGAIR